MSLSPLQDELVKAKAFMFKNWIMTRRNVFTLFEILFWPLVAFLSVGLLTQFANLSQGMKAFILIGVISMSAVQVCQLDVAYALLYDVWSKAIKHSFIAPVGIRHLLLGSLVVGIIRGGAVYFMLMGASYLIFDFSFTVPGPLPTGLYIFGLFLSAATVGAFVCILVLTFGNRAEVAAWSMVSLMLLLCGIYYPISVLPRPIGALAELIPLTYFLDYIRHFYGFESTFTHPLIKGYSGVLAYLLLEVYLIKAAIGRAKRKGLLLKLSE
jgi:ABC-2 type transport system permease protein